MFPVLIALILACPLCVAIGVLWGRRLERRDTGPSDDHIAALLRELRPASEDEHEFPFTF